MGLAYLYIKGLKTQIWLIPQGSLKDLNLVAAS